MAEKKYIERKAAYTLAKKVCKAVDSNPRVLLPRIILDLIDNLPAADVRPVVTCGECIHRHDHRRQSCIGRRPDFFCADGEKREES